MNNKGVRLNLHMRVVVFLFTHRHCGLSVMQVRLISAFKGVDK